MNGTGLLLLFHDFHLSSGPPPSLILHIAAVLVYLQYASSPFTSQHLLLAVSALLLRFPWPPKDAFLFSRPLGQGPHVSVAGTLGPFSHANDRTRCPFVILRLTRVIS